MLDRQLSEFIKVYNDLTYFYGYPQIHNLVHAINQLPSDTKVFFRAAGKGETFLSSQLKECKHMRAVTGHKVIVIERPYSVTYTTDGIPNTPVIGDFVESGNGIFPYDPVIHSGAKRLIFKEIRTEVK